MFAAEVCAKDWGELSRESDTGDGNGGKSHDGWREITVVTERAGEERRRIDESCEELTSVEEPSEVIKKQRYDAVGSQRRQQRLPSVKIPFVKIVGQNL
jgi:hypothetical protein